MTLMRARGNGLLAVAFTAILILLVVSSSHGRSLTGRRCADDFFVLDKVEESSSDLPAKTKSPIGAMIRSGLVPGWGQLYNEQYLKSGVVFMLEGMLIGGAVVEHRRSEDDRGEWKDPTKSDQKREAAWSRFSRRVDKRNTYLWYLAGVKFLSIVDAFVDAHLYWFEEGPFAVNWESRPGESWNVRLVMSYQMR